MTDWTLNTTVADYPHLDRGESTIVVTSGGELEIELYDGHDRLIAFIPIETMERLIAAWRTRPCLGLTDPSG
jgi:hypothetical protein